jgi:hypothetical protein
MGLDRPQESVDTRPLGVTIANERRNEQNMVGDVMRQQLMTAPVRNDRTTLEGRVGEAGGRVNLYFRDVYAGAQPDRTLCGPLTSLYLLHGTDAVLIEVGRGFEVTTGLRHKMDGIQQRLASRQQELGTVAVRIQNFERDYYNVSHGPNHHAVKQREMAGLTERKGNLEEEIRSLSQASIELLWQGRLGDVRQTSADRFPNILNDLAARNPGKYSLSFDRPGATGHVLGLEVAGTGQVRLFDPDWGFMTFRNMEGVNKYLASTLTDEPSFLAGTVMLAKLRD